MSTPMVLNTEYELLQGKNAVILTDQTVTLQAKYKDTTDWATLVATGTDPSYTIPFMKEATFRLSAVSGGNSTNFDYSPDQG